MTANRVRCRYRDCELRPRTAVLTGLALNRTIATDGKSQGEMLLQLDRLALPVELRGDPHHTPPGADLLFLGIKKKGSVGP